MLINAYLLEEGMVLDEKYHSVALIDGGLNGTTVVDACVALDELVDRHRLVSKPVKFTRFKYTADYFNEKRITELPKEEMQGLRLYDAILLGAVGDPTKINPGVLELGVLLKIRQEFDQAVNLRPVILQDGIECPLAGKTSKDVNLEFCRENTEGLYIGKGWIENLGTENEAGYQIMKCTYKGVKRLVDYAIKRALERPGRRPDRVPRVHIVFKNNVLTFAASPWNRVHNEVKGRTDVDVRYMHVDNFGMQLVRDPSQFDVVATENMFGDFLTDLGAEIQGGIGSAVSGNINLTGEYPSLFEPIHGTAPDKWYKKDSRGNLIPGSFDHRLVELIRPEAMFLAYAMMLGTLEKEASRVVEKAVLENLRDPNYKIKTLTQLVNQACHFVMSS